MSAPRAGDHDDDALLDRESPPDERLIEDVKSYEGIGAGRESAEGAEE